MAPKKKKDNRSSKLSVAVVVLENEIENNVPVNNDNQLSVGINSQGTRQKSQRASAVKSIVKFARSSENNNAARERLEPISSTPTGLSYSNRAEVDEPQEWPGPFATAHSMIEKRDAARQKRLESIAMTQGGNIIDLEDLDDVDIKIQTLNWSPSCQQKFYSVASLKDVAIDFIANNFESVADLGQLSLELKEKLADKVARMRKIRASDLAIFSPPESMAMSIPDCSDLSEETIIQALEKLCTRNQSNENVTVKAIPITASSDKKKSRKRKQIDNNSNNNSGDSSIQQEILQSDDEFTGEITYLHLHNCGHCFSDRTALVLAHLGHRINGPGLKDLSLRGCYRLADSCLTQLLSRCLAIHTLEITSNSRLGSVGISAISQLPHLKRLVITNCPQLQDEDLISLSNENTTTPPPLSNLVSLRLEGLTAITDEVIIKILKRHGDQLTLLSIKGCLLLSPATVICIREYCPHLMSIDLSQCELLDTPTLLGLFLRSTFTTNITTTTTTSSLQNNIIITNNNTGNNGNITTTTLGNGYRDGHPVLRSLASLHSVYLSDLVGVTDDVLTELCLETRGGLRTLYIDGCSQVTNKGFYAVLLYGAKSLHHLNISFVRGISEDMLGILVDTCPHLNVLDVWGCTQLTDRFFNGHSKQDSRLVINGRLAK